MMTFDVAGRRAWGLRWNTELHSELDVLSV